MTCIKTNKECVYPDRLTYRQYPRGYVENLEDKVRNLEAQIRAMRESAHNDSEGGNSESPSVQSPPGKLRFLIVAVLAFDIDILFV